MTASGELCHYSGCRSRSTMTGTCLNDSAGRVIELAGVNGQLWPKLG